MQPDGLPAREHAGMPAHVLLPPGPCGLPHGTHIVCWHCGYAPAACTLNVVETVLGNGRNVPSAVTHGSCAHVPVQSTSPALQGGSLSQSESVVQVPNLFTGAAVVQRFSPVVPFRT